MRGGRRSLAVLVAVAVLLTSGIAVVVSRVGDRGRNDIIDVAIELSALQRRITTTTTTTTTAPPSPTTQPAPPPTEPPTTTTTAAPVVTSLDPPRAEPWTLGPYQGVGVWLDIYDWTNIQTNGRPKVGIADLDIMSYLGIQTIYIQTAHRKFDADIIEGDRLGPFIDRAHALGMSVVAWYLPTLEDTFVDLRRLVGATNLPIDGLAVDIESLAVGNPAERTRRLLELSTALRQVMGTRAIGAITPSAVHLQVVNPNFWPGFPWPELGSTYDVIVPMSYWSVRRPEWRSGERYIGENIDRIRASTGRPDMPINVAGGIADGITLEDVSGMVRAIQARGIMGASLYDWNTSQPAQWDVLRALYTG
jgi:hypothetical protein